MKSSAAGSNREAQYSAHWAFVPPVRPAVPQLNDSGWVRNPIDAFILARLEREGLAPSPEASRETLIRRLVARSDRTAADAGRSRRVRQRCMRPTPASSWSTGCWPRRITASGGGAMARRRPLRRHRRLREGQAAVRLDVPRLGDRCASTSDLPYDQFIIEQIAGDLLPDATQDTLVATGFLRNSMINEEGGIDPEQFRMEAMFDRMDAIGKGVLGLTIQCAQCHTHKYDPLTHAEYYGLFAFLNNCHEGAATVYTDDQLAQRDAIIAETERVETALKSALPDWRRPDARLGGIGPRRSAAMDDRAPELDASGGQKHYVLEDGSILAAGYAPPSTRPSSRSTRRSRPSPPCVSNSSTIRISPTVVPAARFTACSRSASSARPLRRWTNPTRK